MLSQRYRFHGHGSLRYVYRNGQSVRCHLMTIKYTENKRRKTSRCSIVVSKKIAKHAVDRNRIRRRLYEVVRTSWPYIRTPHDIVIIVATADIAMLPHDELVACVQEQLVTARILPSPVG